MLPARQRGVKANRGSVLIVGQTPEVDAMLAPSLREEGYQVEIARSSKEGYCVAERRRFEVIIFCQKEEKSAQAELVEVARRHNSRVQVIHLEADDLMVLKSCPGATLREVLLQRELRETKRQLLQRLRDAGEAASLIKAVSGIVHEINNPLAAIQGYAQLALTTTSREKLDGYMQTIHQQAVRCQTMVQKIPLVGQRYKPRKSVANLNRIIEKVVALFAHELATNHVELELDLSATQLPVRVDPRQIEHVLVSLIMNAKEALADVRPAKVRIASRSLERKAVVTVSDNGPGIPHDIRKKVFQPFFSTKPGQGGLGLSVSLSVVNDSGGDIEILESGDAGATFRFRLPLADEEVSQQNTTPHHKEPEQDSSKQKRILVVDDGKPVANLVSQILRRGGEKVDVAFTPAKPCETSQGKRSDMILMDVKTLGEDGGEMVRQIKRTNPKIAEKVVLCTGDRLDEEMQHALSGCDCPAAEEPSA
jgi:signal transduction histidine kinase